MLLWTIMPEETVLDGYDRPRHYREIVSGGRKLIVERGEDGTTNVVQLLSSNPQDFLMPEFFPGSKL